MLLECIISFLVIGKVVVAQSYNCSSSFIQINSSTEATTLLQQCPSDDNVGVAGLWLTLGPISGNVSFDGLHHPYALTTSGEAPDLTGVTSNSLYSAFLLTFDRCPALQSLSFPNLTNGAFLISTFTALPLLTELELGADLTIPKGIIMQGTGLKSFSASLPADPDYGDPETLSANFIITQNKDMSQIHLGLEAYITDAAQAGNFLILNNAPGAMIDLPNLKSLNLDTTLGDFSSLNIPLLQVVNGSLNISNAQVSRFSAPSLQNIVGNFSLTGSFSELDLPNLSTVKGDIYIRGATGLNCSLFSQVSLSGTLDCEGTSAPLSTPITGSPTSTTTLPTPSHTPATSSTASATSTGLSSAAKGGIGGGIAAGALLIIVLAVWYCWRRRRRSRAFADKEPKQEKSEGQGAAAELPQGRHHERSELQASPNQVSELTGDQEYRPRPPIESLPVTAPSSTMAVVGDGKRLPNATVSGPRELEWPPDSDLGSSAAS